MKTRIVALFAALLAILPMTSAWANSDVFYYAKATATVSSTGGGKVYASSTSVTSPDSMCTGTTSTSGVGKSAANTQSVTLYRYAKANEGFEFKGWSTADDADVSTISDTSTSVMVAPSATSESGANNYTYYAYFAKLKLAAFGITFETSAGGVYTVDGLAPADKTGLTEATTVKLASADPNFLNWKVNGAIVNGNPYDLTCTAATTVGAEFLTADQVAEATTFDALTAALTNDGKRKITIPAGADIVIARDASVTVPAGKQLVVNGSLAVAGTLANSGAISGNGTIRKVSWLVTQSEVIEPSNTYRSYTSFTMYSSSYSPKYCKTTTAANTPSVTGVTGFAEKWGVLLNGTKVYEISKQNPKALSVSFDTSKAVNCISSINGNIDAISGYPVVYLVLLADLTDTYKHDGYKGIGQSGTIDCAGKKYTASGQIDNHFHPILLNGSAVIGSGSYTQNANAAFINCTSINVNKCKGTCNMHFFDCGTESSLASVTISNYDSGATWNTYFYSGYYNYTFAKTVYVYGGTFSKDPTSYLQNNATENGLEVDTSVSGRYTVKDKKPPEYKLHSASNASAKYETLQQAVAAVAANGSETFALEGGVEILGTVTIPEGKRITIDLGGFNMSGGAIENSGALRLEDNSNQEVKGLFTTPVVNKKGTIDITYGRYGGTFTLEGGTLTTHGGTFTSAFSYEEKGGTANLRGGTYNCAITVPAGHELVGSVLGETSRGVIICDNPLSSADVSYTVRGLDPVDRGLGISDFDLYSNCKHSKSGWMTRSDFAGREAQWDRLAELKCTVEPVESKAFEATMSFDRPVKAGSVSGVASVAGRTETLPLADDIAAGEDYHVFIPMVTGAGYYAISYKNMFNGEENDRWAKLLCGMKNDSPDNIGTTLTFKYQLRTQERGPGYTTQNPVYIYSFATYASATYKFTGKGALVGKADYTSLEAALNAVAEGGSVRLSKDCAEEIEIGRVCSFTLDNNNFEFTGSIAPADGFEMKVADGVYTFTEAMPKGVAQIGETVYETLAKAVAAAKAGDTIKLLKDDETDVVLPEGVALNTNGRRYSGTITTADGFKAVHSDGVWSVESVYVATNGGTGYGTLAEALAAAGTEIVITKSCDETVTVGKVCTIAVAEGVAFSGKLVAADGFVIAKSGSVWTVSAAAAPIEVNVKVGESEAKKAEVVISSATVEKLAESERKLSVDDIQEVVEKAVVLSAGESEQTVKVADETKEVQVKVTDGFAAVKVTDGKSSVLAELGANAQAKDQETGVYQQTKVVEVEGEKIAVPDVTKPVVAVIKDRTADETIILVVPGDKDRNGDSITVANVIGSGMGEGDEIKVYDLATKTYLWWKYENSKWGERAPNPTPAGSYPLAAGTAFWYTRAAGNTNPIVIVAVYEAEAELKTDIMESPAEMPDGKSTAWNLVANANPTEAFDVNTIQSTEKTSVEGDKIIVPLKGLAQRTLTRKDGKWGYIGLKEQEVRPGKFARVNAWIECGDDERKIEPGKGFWYLSNGGKPTLNWGKGDGK